MSLVEVKNSQIIGKQVKYKLKTNMGIFTSLIITQVLAFLLTMSGTAYSSYGGGQFGLSIEIHYYSIDIIVGFTLIWALMIGTTLPKLFDEEVTFIATHQTNTIANIIYIACISGIAAITAVLANYAQKLVLSIADVDLIGTGLSIISDFPVFIGTIYAIFIYAFLLASIGYLIGTLLTISRLFLILIIGILVGMLLITGVNEDTNLLQATTLFFVGEQLKLLLTMKIVVISFISYGFAFILNKRMEVLR